MKITGISTKNLIFTNLTSSFYTLFGVFLQQVFGASTRISILSPKGLSLFLLVMAFEGKRGHSKTNIFQISSWNEEKDSGNRAFFSPEKNSFDHTVFLQWKYLSCESTSRSLRRAS